jgi:high-affinity nickel-transport protein
MISELPAPAVAQKSSRHFIAILARDFSLGMRDTTDADHRSRSRSSSAATRSVVHAALIGALWGAGHTLIILAVKTAIIVFSFVLSPRLGSNGIGTIAGMMVITVALGSTVAYVGRRSESLTRYLAAPS